MDGPAPCLWSAEAPKSVDGMFMVGLHWRGSGPRKPFEISGIPSGIRTRVAALKGRSPRPLDDGDLAGSLRHCAETALNVPQTARESDDWRGEEGRGTLRRAFRGLSESTYRQVSVRPPLHWPEQH